jgi:hypothetical protein
VGSIAAPARAWRGARLAARRPAGRKEPRRRRGVRAGALALPMPNPAGRSIASAASAFLALILASALRPGALQARQVLNDISVLSKSRYGHNLSLSKGVIWRNVGITILTSPAGSSMQIRTAIEGYRPLRGKSVASVRQHAKQFTVICSAIEAIPILNLRN